MEKARVETKNKVRNDPLTCKAIRLMYMQRDLPEKIYKIHFIVFINQYILHKKKIIKRNLNLNFMKLMD